MDDLPLHGLDKELERRLAELARREGVSLNEAALRLLRRGAGLIEPSERSGVVGDALDGFVGRWSEAEERDLLATNDIWIAAHAMESGADLLSFDQHFEQVDGIAWVRPED